LQLPTVAALVQPRVTQFPLMTLLFLPTAPYASSHHKTTVSISTASLNNIERQTLGVTNPTLLILGSHSGSDKRLIVGKAASILELHATTVKP
jgi:hypothetical protein